MNGRIEREMTREALSHEEIRKRDLSRAAFLDWCMVVLSVLILLVLSLLWSASK